MSGKVILVGAGCGKGLITLSGLKEIRRAEALVYDDLIDPGLINEAPDGCKKIYAGKRLGKHSKIQDEINGILLKEALDGRYTVRLKGGDSFVFGRGGEEIQYLKEHGIECAVIPGVSSSIAVPEHFGIPVTHRGTAQSFTVVTGHSANETEEDYRALAGLKGTLVFLMGLNRAAEIADKLMDFGKAPDTPAVILCGGFFEGEKRIDGTLETMGDMAKEAETPAILVVGETASYSLVSPDEARDKEAGPLDGISVTVTGSESFAGRLREALIAEGALVDIKQTIRIVPDTADIPVEFSGHNWLVFTSANGIRVFFDHMKNMSADIRLLGDKRFACIGEGTAKELETHGIYADFIPSEFTAKVLGRELPGVLNPDEKVLILRAENGSAELTEELKAAGVSFTDKKIYHTESIVTEDGYRCESDYLVFASAGGARSFLEGAEIGDKTELICIGDITKREVEKHTTRECFVTERHDIRGLVDIISKRAGVKRKLSLCERERLNSSKSC